MIQTKSSVINTREEFEDVLMNRNKKYFLDKIVVAYVPDKAADEIYEKVVEAAKWNDVTNFILMSYAKTFIRFYKITDPELAEELNIRNNGKLSLYMYKDIRSFFHNQRPR
mmetsp:Transcript_17157/g.2832  ORF Transcript_17157/g.2832 Transcript_17157/m.2832 type:complete len:111 (+) Transcript_17157:351-683(+)